MDYPHAVAVVRANNGAPASAHRRRTVGLRATVRAGILAALTLTVAAALLTAPGLATPASAHDQLISATPADGATLDEAPTEISLTFSDNLIEIGTEVRVLEGATIVDGATDWASGPSELAGPTVTQPVRQPLDDGTYTVVWRVVSSDGHPIEGTYSFVVGDAGTSATPSAAPTSTPEATDSVADAQDMQRSVPSVIRTLVIALIGAAIAVGIVALLVVASRRARRRFGRGNERNNGHHSDDPDDDDEPKSGRNSDTLVH
ncbi:copper resistance CopC family protein [Lysinibacter cavernae]|uniref:CopC domain-containing protein n=1 Tax=Lysinibacter cavernae TaxID=1640652 RepID=A0A7X5R0K4_9MICO|nr:copper resistance CopC family protein [Lysinibacter cavernae]NIH53389.1 hypothetical protein [Lysinibacter cavernae]